MDTVVTAIYQRIKKFKSPFSSWEPIPEIALPTQVTVDDINEIMQERSGLGMTGETFLIGAGGLIGAAIGYAAAGSKAMVQLHDGQFLLGTPTITINNTPKWGKEATINIFKAAF